MKSEELEWWEQVRLGRWFIEVNFGRNPESEIDDGQEAHA